MSRENVLIGGTTTNLIRLQTPKFCSRYFVGVCDWVPQQRFSTATKETTGGVSATTPVAQRFSTATKRLPEGCRRLNKLIILLLHPATINLLLNVACFVQF
jgi:hypothetical protein